MAPGGTGVVTALTRTGLTRTGRLVLGGSAVAAIAGRLLGLLELYVLAAAGAGLVAASAISVLARTSGVEVERSVHPARVHAGNASRVELAITNLRRRPSPVLALADDVTGTDGAHLQISPIRAGATTRAAYRLPTNRRGLITIGPLTLEQTDPLGLVSRTRRVGLRAELTVLPRVVRLLPLPFSLGSDPLAGAEQPNHLGRGGEDFYALRPYAVGDDLRRVHWPSTARIGDLLVRQDEQPWQGRVSVLLDTRRSTADPDTFEEMVTAAASIVLASRRRGDLVRFCTTSGLDSGFVAGHAQIDSIMEQLAVVDQSSARTWAAALARTSSTGSLVAVVGEIDLGDVKALVAARGRARGLTIFRLGDIGSGEPASGDVGSSGDLGRRGSARMLGVPRGVPLEVRWNAAMARPAVSR